MTLSRPLGSFLDLDPKSLLNAVATTEGRKKVVSLRGDDAEVALTALQRELKALGSQSNPKFRTILPRVILRLVDGSRRVPADFWVSDVQELEGEETARGAYGAVYKGSLNGQAVALKYPHCSVEDDLKKFFREVLLWSQLSHENVLPFLGLYRGGPRNSNAMVAPWQSGGNIVEFIKTDKGADRHSLLIQVTNGLTYLHELNPPVVHSDLKPENILINADRTAVLADFGLSHMQHSDLTDLVSSDHLGVKGTLPYCAPEIFTEVPRPPKPSTSRDIWALGMVTYRVFTGKVPFKAHAYPKGICDAILSGESPGPRHFHSRQLGFTDELWCFLKNDCWSMSPEERPSARDCGKRLNELRTKWEDEKVVKLASPYQDFIEEIINVPLKNYCDTLFERRKPYLYSLIEQFGVRIAQEYYGKIKIWGDKINVEAASKDINGDYENFTADQKVASLSVPSRLRGVIIGRGGESVKRLEQEYSVKIKSIEIDKQVSISGQPDNVEKAKARLQSKIDYLLCYNDVCELQANQKLIARLRDRGYLQYTSARLGLRKLPHITDTSIIVRGPKEVLEKAKADFCRLQEEVDREITLTLKVNDDVVYTQLSRLVNGQEAWGDPSKPFIPNSSIILRQENNELLLRGEEGPTKKLEEQLLLEVEKRRKIVLGMAIPHDLHPDLRSEYQDDIRAIQKTTRVYICFPGKEDYDNLSEPKNLDDDLFEADERDIVKIQGNLDACTIACQKLKGLVKEEKRKRRSVTFKAKYHHEVQYLVRKRLKDMGIRVRFSSTPAQVWGSIRTAPLAKMEWISWGHIRRFDLTDEEECTWDLRAKKKELDEGLNILKRAVRQVSAASYQGCLQFSTNTKFGTLIGSNGETIQRLQAETNTKIKVEKHSPIINIIGSKKNMEEARDKIIRLIGPRWITNENVDP